MKAVYKNKKFTKMNEAALVAIHTGYKKLVAADPEHVYTKRAKAIIDTYKIPVE